MSIETLKQLVAALEYHTAQTRPITQTQEAIAAGKAAIEQTENQDQIRAITQEAHQKINNLEDEIRRKVYGIPPAAPVQEPVETEDTMFRQFMSEANKAGVTHWSTPPAAPVQEPAIKQGWDVDTLLDKPAAPVQKWMKPHPKCDEACLFQCTKGFTQFPECAKQAPTVQEPVAYRTWVDGWQYTEIPGDGEALCLCTPPAAQRQWVSLTDEEINACDPQEECWGLHEAVRRAEAILRSKNNG